MDRYNAGTDPQWTAEAVRSFEPKLLIEPCKEYPYGKWEETPAVYIPALRGKAIDILTPLFGVAFWQGWPVFRKKEALLINEIIMAFWPNFPKAEEEGAALYRWNWRAVEAEPLLPEVWAYGKEVALKTWRDKWRWVRGKEPIGR